ncbi:MAG: glycogen synthase, partial [Desulfobacterales bacterium]
MKILMLTNEYPPHIYGGAGVHVDHLVRELENVGDPSQQLQVICFGDQAEARPGLQVTGIGPGEALAAMNLRHPKLLDTLQRNLI